MAFASESAVQEAPAAGGPPVVAGKSPAQIAWGRLRRDRVGMLCLGIIVTVAVIAITTPLIARLIGVTPDFDTNLIGDGGMPKTGWWSAKNTGITSEHWLGVEPVTGRDIFAELLYGSRVSLIVASVATLLTVFFGTLVGIVSGYLGGKVDAALGWLIDLLLSFPQLILLVALSPVVVPQIRDKIGLQGEVAPRVAFIIIVLSVFGWPYLARIIRGQVLSLREREFVEAAVSIGSGTRRILFKEILPNLWVPIIVYSTLLLPAYIAAEAGLSFLGVSVGEPTPTWGRMLAESVNYSQVAPLYLFIPGTALIVVVLAFNLLGDSVRDALDPRAGRA
jgi:peptide/nickel transport system permease protein